MSENIKESEDCEEINNECAEWKNKLRTVLYSNNFCGICFEEKNNVWNISETINIADLGPDNECTFQQLVADLCNEDPQNLFSSTLLCNECAESAINAILFIHNARKSSKVITNCLLTLEENVQSTLNTIEDFNDYEKSIICVDLQSILAVESLKCQTKSVHMPNNTISKDDHINIVYNCSICSDVFDNERIWNEHQKEHLHSTEINSDVVQSVEVTEVTNDAIDVPHVDAVDSITVREKLFAHTHCDHCKVFVPNNSYEQHMKIHLQRTWNCTLCDKVFYSSSSFDTHIMARHNLLSKENLITCKLCLKTYFSKETLNQHKCKYRCNECRELPCAHEKYLIAYRDQKEAGHKLVQCVDCQFTCSRKISLVSHVNLDHLDSFNHLCDTCSQSFHSKQALSQHTLKCHGETLSCEFCDLPFKGRIILEKHKATCRVINRVYKCISCPASFDVVEHLVMHNEKHTESNNICCVCSIAFTTPSDLDNHKRHNHKTKIPCSMCMEDFDSSQEYSAHVASHQPGTKHLCRLCGLTFNSRFNHRKHLNLHTMSLEKKQCPVCDKYVSHSHLRYHVQTHYSVRNERKKVKHIKQNCKCDLCGKWFASDKVLRRHREKHKEEIKCGYCMKFVKPMYLENHLLNHKLQKSVSGKKIKCQECDYGTNYPLCMDAHINRVHRKTRPYSCEKCGKSFYGKITLYEHMRSHTDTTVTGRQCEQCGVYFCNSFSLKTHMRLHTGEKPYKCDQCDERFISASRRKEHMLKRHTTPNVPCPICNNLYFSARDVRAHIKKTHCNIRKGPINIDQLQGKLSEEHMYIFKDLRLL